MRLGVVVNAGAGRVRRNPRVVEALRAIAGAAAVRLTRSADEVTPALRALRERGTDTLMIAGGDGTVTGTLTPLLRTWPAEELPAVALCRGGTVNTIARSIGSGGALPRVARQLQDGRPLELRRRAVLVAHPVGGEPCYGMVFVNGVGIRWLDMYHRDSRRGVSGALSVIGRIAGSALVGGELAQRTFAPFRAALVVDGEQLPGRDYTIMAAASIREIGLGFAPFHTAGSDPGRVHLAVTSAGALRILGELPGALARRQVPRSALVHFSIGEAEILSTTPQAWSLDAESFPPARELRIGAGPVLDFVSVGRRFG